MPYIILLVVILGLVVYLSSRPEQAKTSKEWIKKGGMLGLAILFARFVRLPLATIMTLLPFFVPHLRKAEQAQQKSGSAMTREEAALILGVSTNAAKDEIEKAHRKLITRNHPDKGGNDYLAAKINQARDVLLG